MRVSLVILTVSLCLAIVCAKLDELRLKEIKSNIQPQLEDLQENHEAQLDEITRKKKSAVTTFCVEIRPMDQKPYQLCENRGYENAPVPYDVGYQKPQQTFNSGGASAQKPAPAYSAPVKTYSSSAGGAAVKPGPTYGTFRSTKPDNEAEEEEEAAETEKLSAARASKPETADKTVSNLPTSAAQQSENQEHAAKKTVESKGEREMDSMRVAHRQDPYSYSASYGTPTSMIPVAPVNHGHSGLVITCQPNLAGYAHGVPGRFNNGKLHGAEPLPSYRSASGAYTRPYPTYRPQPQSYGSYKPFAPRPVYRPQTQVYKNPYSHPVTEYKQPVHTQAFKPSAPVSGEALFTSPESKPSAFQPMIPNSEYAPTYQGSPPSSPPVYSSPASQAYYPAAPEYKPAYTPPINYKPPVYSGAYATPGTYRAAIVNKENKPEDDKVDKEGHTLSRMAEISEKRAEGTRWDSELKELNIDEKTREADNGPWRNAEVIETSNNDAWREAEEANAGGGWREAEEANAGGGWREAEEANAGGGWREAEEANMGGGWREAEEANAGGGWREADESNADSRSRITEANMDRKWIIADGAKSAEDWRNIAEALEFRDAAPDHEHEEFRIETVGNPANHEYINDDISQGVMSSENKIEEP